MRVSDKQFSEGAWRYFNLGQTGSVDAVIWLRHNVMSSTGVKKTFSQ